MRIRRATGGLVMGAGALLFGLGGLLALFLAVNFLDVRNAVHDVATIGLFCGPLLAAGLAVIATGRLVFGGKNAPAARIIGGVTAGLSGVAALGCLAWLSQLCLMGIATSEPWLCVRVACAAALTGGLALAGYRMTFSSGRRPA